MLTEIAFLAFERVGRDIDAVGHSDDVVADVRAVSLAFVSFAISHPGQFRLMFRGDMVNRTDLRYPELGIKPGTRFSHHL